MFAPVSMALPAKVMRAVLASHMVATVSFLDFSLAAWTLLYIFFQPFNHGLTLF